MNEYFSPENLAAAAPVTKVFNPLFYGAPQTLRYLVQPHFGFGGAPSLQVNTGFGLVLAWLIVLPYAYIRARRLLISGNQAQRNTAIVIGFLLINVLYVYATSTMLELAENNRYKFMIEPIFLVLAISACVDGLRRVRKH